MPLSGCQERLVEFSRIPAQHGVHAELLEGRHVGITPGGTRGGRHRVPVLGVHAHAFDDCGCPLTNKVYRPLAPWTSTRLGLGTLVELGSSNHWSETNAAGTARVGDGSGVGGPMTSAGSQDSHRYLSLQRHTRQNAGDAAPQPPGRDDPPADKCGAATCYLWPRAGVSMDQREAIAFSPTLVGTCCGLSGAFACSCPRMYAHMDFSVRKRGARGTSFSGR